MATARVITSVSVVRATKMANVVRRHETAPRLNVLRTVPRGIHGQLVPRVGISVIGIASATTTSTGRSGTSGKAEEAAPRKYLAVHR